MNVGAGQGGRIKALDGLRTIAVGLVFAHHVDQVAMPGGFIGVDLFFVISGFLITYLLLREREKTGAISLSRFYVRRALRLYPALIVLVIVVTPLAWAFQIGYPIVDGLAALLYVTNFYSNLFPHLTLLLHTWSLAVEEQFYLVWPVALMWILRRRMPLRSILCATALVSVVITYFLHAADLRRVQLVQFLPTSHIPELVAGILLALAVHREPKSLLRALASAPVAIAALAALAAALFWLPDAWWSFPLSTLACFPPVAHLVLQRGSRISRLLSVRPLVWLGERSYGCYLWHYPILILLIEYTTLNSWSVAAIAVPLTLMITAVSWRVIEAPFLRMKGRFEPEPPSADE